MICPACKINSAQNLHAEHCVQCGADIQIHRLLREIGDTIPMKETVAKPEQTFAYNGPKFFLLYQLIPSTLLLLCVLFGVFVGLRLLSFIDQAETQRTQIATKWSETGFVQLQQMNGTIKQELELILDQRRENLALQATVQHLRKSIALAKNAEQAPLPSLVQGWKE